MKVDHPYDLAIVGGGLGGLSLAIQMARAGRRVVLLEKDGYPKHRVCGEYISMESWPHLQQLGIPLDRLQLPRISRLEVTATGGKKFAFPLPLGGFGISRYTLDHLLYQQAKVLGVQVLAQCKVLDVAKTPKGAQVETAQGTIAAAIAVLAHGKRSNLDIKWNRPFAQARKGPLHNWVGVKYHARLPFAADLIQLHNFRDGYCGVSMVEDNTVCICYLMRASNLRLHGNDLRQTEAAILKANPALRAVLDQATMLYDAPQVISQVSFSAKQPVERNLMMVGDSAGMIAPLCGNGMSMALHASKLAFGALEGYFSGKMEYNAALQQYATNWQQQFGTRLRIGRTIQRFFGAPMATGAFLRLMTNIPGAASMLISRTHGKPF